jgi:hypothetical protein
MGRTEFVDNCFSYVASLAEHIVNLISRVTGGAERFTRALMCQSDPPV